MKKKLFLLSILFLGGCTGADKQGDEFVQNEYSFIKGVNFHHKGKKKEALKEYEKVYKNNPENLMAIKELAVVNGELGNTRVATDFLKTAYEIAPKDESIIKNLANIYYEDKRFDESEKYLDMLPKNSKDDAVLKLRGYIAYEKKNYEETYNYLKKVQEEKYDKRFYEILKNTFIKLNKNKELYFLLEEKYKIYNNQRDYVILYCDFLSKIFDEKEYAERVLVRYISEYNGDDEIFLILSDLYLKNNKKDKAINSFKLISDDYKYNSEYKKIRKKLNDNDFNK